ncbi:MAG: MurR/RpiR family transcriptional regulator [Emcibacter sp.]|nr:MurR/RpiR family transcriptional regulator [Emcibacter sp.]
MTAENSQSQNPANNLGVLIRSKLDRLTSKERIVARTLLNQYPTAGLCTIAALAEIADVSGPTVLRTIKKLGFKSYGNFQTMLRKELQLGFQAPLDRVDRSDTPPGGEASFASYAEACMQNIQLAHMSVNNNEYNAVISLLSDESRPVFLIGGRFTDSLARYFYFHLHILRAHVNIVPQQRETWPEVIYDFGIKDIIIVFDVRRYQRDILLFCEQAKKRGSQIILFTDQWLSPISAIADHIFPMPTAVPSQWDSAVATLVLLESIVAKLSERNHTSINDRIKKLEALRQPLHSDLIGPK